MSTFRASPFPSRSTTTGTLFPRSHAPPSSSPLDLDDLRSQPMHNPSTPSRNLHTPSRAPRSHIPRLDFSAACRSLTPSFSRLRTAEHVHTDDSSASTHHTHSSRFGFAAFRDRRQRAKAPSAPAFRTPERATPTSTYRKYVSHEDYDGEDAFDEDRISKTPAKGRNDEWLASLGFDLSLLKLSAQSDDQGIENRHPNLFDARLSPRSFTLKPSPRRSTPMPSPQRLAMPVRDVKPAVHETSTTSMLPRLSHVATPLAVREQNIIDAPEPRADTSLSDLYVESSVSTEYVDESHQAATNRENFRATPDGATEETSPFEATVPEITIASPASESSTARLTMPPPHDAVVGTPKVARRHTELAYETSTATDAVFRTPKSRPSSSRRDAPLGKPKTPRRHTDWRVESATAAESCGLDPIVTPGRVRSARKSRRSSARVSTRELRALVEAQESMGIKTDDTQGTPLSTRKTRGRQSSTVKMEGGAGAMEPNSEHLSTANFVLSPVRATKQQKEALGSEKIVTPVRRSLRISMRHVPIIEIDDVGEHNAERLESADYAFLPNRNLKEKVDVDRKNPLR